MCGLHSAPLDRHNPHCEGSTEEFSDAMRTAPPARRALATMTFPFRRTHCLTAGDLSPRRPDHILTRNRSFLADAVVRGEQMSITQFIDLKVREGQSGAAVPRLARFFRFSPRRALLVGVAIAACAGAADYGWYYWTTGRFEVSTDDAYVRADSTVIAPKVSGYLRDVLVQDNEQVKAGQVLAKIDDRDYVVALVQAQADVAASQGEIDNIKATIARQQAVIAQAAGTVAVDEAALTFAEQDYARYASLASRGAGTVQMAQQATMKRDAARAALTRDKAALTAAKGQTDVLHAQLTQANATLEHKRAVTKKAELDVGYTTVTAPVDGVVGNRTLRIGQFVQAGTNLMAVVPMRGAYIVANFKETQLTNIRKGQPVKVEVDSFPGTEITGHVDSIAPASAGEFALLPPDNATGNFTKVIQRIPVKIILDPQSGGAGRLRPGMSVEPVVDTKDAATRDGLNPRTAMK
jgi:membrane fusion protein (multidrug efflux system)